MGLEQIQKLSVRGGSEYADLFREFWAYSFINKSNRSLLRRSFDFLAEVSKMAEGLDWKNKIIISLSERNSQQQIHFRDLIFSRM